MAAYNKFNVFTVDQAGAKHNFVSDTFKVVLTNSAPVAANALLSDITDLTTSGGYTAGGTGSACTLSNASGVEKYVFAPVTFTATSGFGPFRYAVLYNFTQATPLKPLIQWADYGAAVTLLAGETFTWTPDAAGGLFTVT